jgi:D-alanyl-D-alanine carboxypeptidase
MTAVWLLTGCSQEPNVYYYPLEEITQNRITSMEKAAQRIPCMAAELCVVTGEEPEPDDSVIAEAAGVFSEADQSVPVQKNVYKRLYPASITKVMTALLAVKYGDLDAVVTTGNETVITEAGASLAKLNPGDTLTLRQLLYGLMLPSGNDAGAAIAVHMAGSMEAFAQMMNQEAYQLGATGTHFVNAHGLNDPEHYTTAYDLYLIFHEALKYPEFREIIHTTSYTAEYTDQNGETISQTWTNSNKYLNGERDMPEGLSVIGGKTGTTKAAGYCLLLASEDENGDDYISVILKSDSRDHLYDSMTNIIQKIHN